MRKITKLFLTLLVIHLPNIAFATPIISITSDKPLRTTVGVGETAYIEYLIKAKPGLPIIFHNQFPPMIQQIFVDTEEYCTTKTTIPYTGQCRARFKLIAPRYAGTINGKIKICVEGLRASCTQHEITVQVVEAMQQSNESVITTISPSDINKTDDFVQTPTIIQQDTTIPDIIPKEIIVPSQNVTIPEETISPSQNTTVPEETIPPFQNTTAPDVTPGETIPPSQNTTETDAKSGETTVSPKPEPLINEIQVPQQILSFQPKNAIYNSPFYGIYTDSKNIYTVTGNNFLLVHDKNSNSQIWESITTDDDNIHLVDVCTTLSENTYALSYDGSIYRLTKDNTSYKLSKITANNENMYGSNELYCSGSKIYTTSLYGLFGNQYPLSIYDEKGSRDFIYQTYNDLKLDKTNKAYEIYATLDNSKFSIATNNGISICYQPSNCTNYKPPNPYISPSII